MINLRSLPLCVLASVLVSPLSSLAQQAAPAVRIVNPVNESQRITLTHTVNPLANAANDRGAAPDGMQLDRLQLVLQRSTTQETALRQLIAEQNTPGSPSYHQWLTPQQFGTQFGASDQDIVTVESWLGSHGFAISRVNPGKGTLEFSGSVAQLREAFHTQIHRYSVDGETHYANADDPQVPAALAPAIAGFTSLNNFRPRSYLQKLGRASFNPATHQVSQWTWGTSTNEYFVLAPSDFAVQYDLQPLYTAGVNGTGQTIAIINESNINIDLVNQYRALFGLPANPPQVIIDGNDPGVDGINNPDGPNYASTEAYLDVEEAGAVAPNAQIDLVIAGDTSIEGGLVLAMEHAVYADVAPVLSISFGSCESLLGATNAFINSLWEQAAAQGQTVMVSSGDDGSAGCDNDNSEHYATAGQAVNGFASTPYNVAVGGTDFYYSDYATGGASIATYWSTTPSQLPVASLIKAPIPEQPWNNSQFGLNIYNQYAKTATTSIAGGSGGASNAAVCSAGYNASTGACNGTPTGYPKPSWQTGAGVPNDNVRDLPDVSLFAANGSNESFYPICATDADCQSPSGSNLVQISGVGGTSASAPAFAGIMALVNQKYGPQGQSDNILYALKTQFPGVFHDVTNGTNSVPCEFAPTVSPNCIAVTSPATVSGITEGQIGTGTTPEYNATAGYNLATGLGTIDANLLVTDWSKVTLAASGTTMTPSQTSFTHGTSITISGSVTGSTPTGNVALMTDSTEPSEQGQKTFPLSSGAYSGTTSTLPGGTYNIWAQYGGDAKNAMSVSPKEQITVAPETPGMAFYLFDLPQSTGLYYTPSSGPGTQVDYGTQLMLSSEVAPASQLTNLENCVIKGTGCSSLSYTQPTGTVTFADNSNTINTAVMNAEGDAEYNAPFAVGAHSVVATYNGDQSYNKITSSPITFTVVKDSPEFFYGASNVNSSQQIISGQPTVFNVIVENGAQYNVASQTNGASAPVPVLPPTGTVTLSSQPSGISGTIPLSSGVDPSDGAQAGIGTVTLSSLAANNYNVTFTYSGDNNYVGGSATGTISVAAGSGGLASTVNATISGNTVSPNASILVTGTVTGQSGHPAPSGGVIFFSSGENLGEVNLTAGSGDVSTFSAVLNSQDLFQGANFVTLQYTGDSTYAISEFTLNSGNSISNPLADFSLVPATIIVPVATSGSSGNGTDIINAMSVNGFTGTVSMGCSATLPLTCSVSPNPTLSSNGAATSTLSINVPSGTANGNFNVSVTGKDSSGEYIHTLGITVDVSGEPTTANFALTSAGGITVVQNATTGNTSTVYVTPANGFTGSVTMSCTVAGPSGPTSQVTCGVTPLVSVPGKSSVTATVTANSTSTTTPGSYSITVTGVNGSITQTAAVSVTVNSAAVPAYTLAATGPSSTISPGTAATASIKVTGSGGYVGSVSLSCSMTSGPTNQAGDAPTCSISGGSPVALSSSTTSGSATATVSSTAATADLVVPAFGKGKGWLGAGSGAVLALLFFFGIPARRRSWRAMLGIVVAMVALGVMSSCGGGGGSGGGGGGTTPKDPGTAAGTYTFTVTSSGNPAVTPAPTNPTFTVTFN
jgi:trimeric autotransporter adhesin